MCHSPRATTSPHWSRSTVAPLRSRSAARARVRTQARRRGGQQAMRARCLEWVLLSSDRSSAEGTPSGPGARTRPCGGLKSAGAGTPGRSARAWCPIRPPSPLLRRRILISSPRGTASFPRTGRFAQCRGPGRRRGRSPCALPHGPCPHPLGHSLATLQASSQMRFSLISRMLRHSNCFASSVSARHES